MTHSDENNHLYENGDQVILWMNTIHPRENNQEIYSYYKLPYCKGSKVLAERHESLSESLLGMKLEFSGLDIKFNVNKSKDAFCKIVLDQNKILQFSDANDKKFVAELLVDGLPCEFRIGGGQPFNMIYTHMKITFQKNQKHIVGVTIVPEEILSMSVGKEVTFTYEVVWQDTTKVFSDRFNIYFRPNFFNSPIHSFSIFNSFFMVLFLVFVVAMILRRTINQDYRRYNSMDTMTRERDFIDEYGWKQVHADVFRRPKRFLLLTSLCSCGIHLCFSIGMFVFTVMVNQTYTEKITMISTMIACYVAMSPVGSFFGASLFSQYGGTKWKLQVILGSSIFPVFMLAVSIFTNIVSISNGVNKYITFYSMFLLFLIYFFLVLPTSLLGGFFGRQFAGKANFPCRISPLPKMIPFKLWYLNTPYIQLISAMLPYGSIFIEIYYIFTYFWSQELYHVYSFLLIVFVLLILTTICVSIVSTYLLLNSEDYRWHWTSYSIGFGISIYCELYSIYYFFYKTLMYGPFQTTFYLTYTMAFSVVIGLMCGSISYFASNSFVNRIYQNVKVD